MRNPILALIVFVLNAIFGFILLIIFLRFVFIFLGARMDAPFTLWLNQISGPFIYPFTNIFPLINIGPFVLEPASLVAIIVYGSIFYLITSLINYLAYPKEPPDV